MTNAELAAKVAELTKALETATTESASHIQSLEERIAVLEQEKIAAYDDAALVARVEALENSKLPAGAVDLFKAAGDAFMQEWISTVLHKYHANDMPAQLPVSDPVDG